MRGRLAVIVLAIAAVAVAFLLRPGDEEPSNSRAARGAPAPPNAVIMIHR